MDWYEQEVQALEAALAQRRSGPPPVVFYGSSSFRLWTTVAEDLHDPRILNLAFGGSTLAACAWYFGRLVVPVRPRSLVIYAGDNDLGDGATPEQVFGSFQSLARRVDAALGPVPFTFLSIKPSPARVHLDAAIRQANALVREAILRRPNGYFIDVHSAMLDGRGAPRKELYAPDGLHLSAAGYRVWARVLSSHAATIF